jgi:hypothetical protein
MSYITEELELNMNKILAGILMIVCTSLSAQYNIRDGNGTWIVKDGARITSSGPVHYPRDTAAELSFSTLYSWDFEDMDYGFGSYTDLETYFVLDDVLGLDWWQDTIIDATIDGVTSKAMKIMAFSGTAQQSIQMWTFFAAGQPGLEKLCYTYHVRFDAGFEAISNNGKLPGILVNGNAYETDQSCPADSANGSTIGYLYKGGLQFSDYHWSHNGNSCPWRVGEGSPSGFHFNPGTWYEITEYLVMNSSDGSSDGIQEIYIDGNMIFQTDTMRWRQNAYHFFDGLRFTFFQSAPTTSHTSSWTTDNHIVYEPIGDATYDAGTTHDPSYILTSPNTLSDRSHYYDNLITADGAYSTSGYPSVTPSGWHEAWRIESTTGVEITFSGQLGGSDWLFVTDGGNSTDDFAYAIAGYDADISDRFDGGGATFTTSSTEVSVWTLNSEDSGFTKFEMLVDIDP